MEQNKDDCGLAMYFDMVSALYLIDCSCAVALFVVLCVAVLLLFVFLFFFLFLSAFAFVHSLIFRSAMAAASQRIGSVATCCAALPCPALPCVQLDQWTEGRTKDGMGAERSTQTQQRLTSHSPVLFFLFLSRLQSACLCVPLPKPTRPRDLLMR